MNLNLNKWKYFDFVKIFDIRKGFYNKKPDASGMGEINFIGATDHNNGVTEKYTMEEIANASKTGDPPNEVLSKKLFPAHAVCVTNNGSVGYAYYQDKPFTCSHDVNPLYLIDGEFNTYTGLFVATVIMHDRYRWGYGRKWRPERMVKSKIKLPIKYDEVGAPIIDGAKTYSEDGYVPDWDFIEQYMKSLHHKPITTKVADVTPRPFETDKWQEFFLHRIFKVSMGNGIDAISTTNNNPKYNYIGREGNNNGVAGFVDEIDGSNPFPSGAITLALGGSLGACFLQKYPFYTAQNVGVLQEKVQMSDYTKLFLITLIQKECKIKYQAFGRELNAHFRKDFTIKLPIKQHEDEAILDETCEFSDEGYIPDWEWMENYIKSLPYSDRI